MPTQTQEKKLTKTQIQTILDSTPKHIKTEDVLNGLLGRGFVLEGLNDAPVKKEPNIMQKIADTTIGGAQNIAETGKAYIGAGGSYVGQKIGNAIGTNDQKNTFNELLDQEKQTITETNRPVNNTLFGRDSNIRDLSTSKGWEQLGGDTLSTLSTVAPGGASLKGASLGTKVVQGAKIGAGVGAVAGAGQSMQDGDNLGDVAKETAMGGAVGLAVGGTLPVIFSGTEKLFRTSKKGSEKLIKTGGEIKDTFTQGVDAPENVKSSLNPFKTESINSFISIPNEKGAVILKKITDVTPEEKVIYQQKVSNTYSQMLERAKVFAKDRRDNFSPLEIVGKNTDEALTKVNTFRKQVGKQMGDIEKANPNSFVDLTKTNMQDFMDNVASRRDGVSYTGSSKLTQETNDFLKALNLLQKQKPSVQEVLRFTRQWDTKLKNLKDGFGKFKENPYDNTLIEGVVNNFKNSARDTLSQVDDQYRNLVSKYRITSQMLEDGNRLMGKDGMMGEAIKGAATAKRAVQSNSDGGARQFYNKLKELTGYDGIQEADIAIQAMKDAGDYQGLSLLEVGKELIDRPKEAFNIFSPSDVSNKVVEMIGKKIRPNAEKRTKNYIQNQRDLFSDSQVLNKKNNFGTSKNKNAITQTNNIPPATSNINISGIIAQSPKKAKEVLKGLISQLPTATKNALIKELTSQVNE